MPALLLILLAIMLTGPQLQAAQTAVVQVEQAPIYADKEMTSPLGQVPMGKKLRVGSVARNRGQVVPVIVSGKVAWIRIKDLYLEDDLVSLKKRKFNRHQELVEELEKDRLRHRNKSFSLTYGRFQAGKDWQSTSTVVNTGEEVSLGEMFDFRMGMPLSFTEAQSLRVGGNYLSIHDRNMSFKAYGGAVDWSQNLGEYANLSAEITGTFLLYPQGVWKILGDSLSGQAVGTKILLDTTYYLGKNTGLKFDLGYTWIRLLGFSLTGGTNIESAELDGVIAGPHLNAGMIYRF